MSSSSSSMSATSGLRFDIIGQPPSLLARLRDPADLLSSQSQPGSSPSPPPDVAMPESPFVSQPSTSRSLLGRIGLPSPTTTKDSSRAHKSKGDAKGNTASQDIFKIPLTSANTAPPPTMSSHPPISSFCLSRPPVPAAPSSTTASTPNAVAPADVPSTHPPSTSSSASPLVDPHVAASALTTADLYRHISELGFERMELNEARLAHQHVLDIQKEYNRRHEETLSAAVREKEQMDKLVAAVLDALDKTEKVRDRQEKRWGEENSRLESLMKAKEEEEKRFRDEEAARVKTQKEAEAAAAKKAMEEAEERAAREKREAEERAAREKREAEERAGREKREAEERAAREKREAEERAVQEKREDEERAARKKREVEEAKARAKTAEEKAAKALAEQVARERAKAQRERLEDEAQAKAIEADKARAEQLREEIIVRARAATAERTRKQTEERARLAHALNTSVDAINASSTGGTTKTDGHQGVAGFRISSQMSFTTLAGTPQKPFQPTATIPPKSGTPHNNSISQVVITPISHLSAQTERNPPSRSTGATPSPVLLQPSAYVPTPVTQSHPSNMNSSQASASTSVQPVNAPDRVHHRRENSSTETEVNPDVKPSLRFLSQPSTLPSDQPVHLVMENIKASPSMSTQKIPRSVWPPTTTIASPATSIASRNQLQAATLGTAHIQARGSSVQNSIVQPTRQTNKNIVPPIKFEPVDEPVPPTPKRMQPTPRIPQAPRPNETKSPALPPSTARSPPAALAPPPVAVQAPPPVVRPPLPASLPPKPVAPLPPVQMRDKIAPSVAAAPTSHNFNARHGDRSGRPPITGLEVSKGPIAPSSGQTAATRIEPTNHTARVSEPRRAASPMAPSQWRADLDDDAWVTTPRDDPDRHTQRYRSPTPGRRYDHWSPSPEHLPHRDQTHPSRPSQYEPPSPPARKRIHDSHTDNVPFKRPRYDDSGRSPRSRRAYSGSDRAYTPPPVRYRPPLRSPPPPMRRTPSPPPYRRYSPQSPLTPIESPASSRRSADWGPPDSRSYSPQQQMARPLSPANPPPLERSVPQYNTGEIRRPLIGKKGTQSRTEQPSLVRRRDPAPIQVPARDVHPDLLSRMSDGRPQSEPGAAQPRPESTRSRRGNPRGRGRGGASAVRGGRGGSSRMLADRFQDAHRDLQSRITG
ncbi:hypothetical protein BDY19DRAFT_404897 [Irpex rosettiformis]|uniref:Uncharacterized protein n=1 Tax=Irpex rosettiformis TaxID=378272 RepID=A0ACB8UFI8_9APHY|nr:hypothetical protein BDY19DRAFT_404897 [Irpex rosettiformis]